MKTPDRWLQLSVPTTEASAELISGFLFALGAQGVVEQSGCLEAYFSDVVNDAKERTVIFLQALQKQGLAVDPDQVRTSIVENQDWNAEWKKGYTSLRVGKNILIHPSWEPAPADAPGCVIQIDPEMAFGTGTHATTQLCLRLLEEHVRPQDWVLDIGTGAGILAIAAIKLGAAAVYAFDVDEVAVETARKNAAANNVLSAVHLSVATMATFKPPARRFDRMVANINRDQIVKMLPLMQKMLDYPVQIILSGILVEEEEIIARELAFLQWELCEVYHQQEWLACVAQKTG